MGDDSDGAVDLFGAPWRDPRDRRGRKAHRRSPEVAEKVALLRATGSTQEDIERRLGISVKTLRRYYSRELADGATLARQVLIEAMWPKAMAGNAAAARFIDEKLREGDAKSFEAAVKEGRTVSPQTTRTGKKAAAKEAALTAGAGSEWGDDLAFGQVQ